MDIYRIGVSIALANGISPVLALIGRDMLGLHATVGKIEKGFGKWAVAIGGAGMALAGSGILTGLAKIADHGTKLLDQQDQLMRNGIEQNEVLKLQKDYYDNISKAVPTSTAAEYLKTVKELRAVTGSTEEAARLAPKALKVDTLLSNTFGTEMHGEYYKLLRAEEMKGIATNEAKREAFTDAAFSYITAFGGKLTARDYQTLARRGGAAFINMKPEAMGPLSVLTADLGGESTGTAMMTFHQLMTGANTMSKQQGQMWQDLGLIDMKKVTKTGFGGSRLQLGLGALKGSLEHAGDLPGWVHDTLWPAIEKASGGDPAKREAIISKLAPNRNANKMIHMFGDAGFADQIMKDLALGKKVEDIETAYKNYIARNPKGVKQGFNDQYESMMQAVGAPMMQAAIPVMKAVTDMFTSLGKFANDNPEKIKLIGMVLAGVGAALVVLGGLALASLVALPLAITAVVGALTAMIALNWDAIRTGLLSVHAAIGDFIDWIAGIPEKVRNSLKGLGLGIDPSGGSHPGKDGKPWHPTSFDPGTSRVKATPISMSLNVDGRQLAQSISEQLENLYEHATGAPSYDGMRRHIPADGGLIGT